VWVVWWGLFGVWPCFFHWVRVLGVVPAQWAAWVSVVLRWAMAWMMAWAMVVPGGRLHWGRQGLLMVEGAPFWGGV